METRDASQPDRTAKRELDRDAKQPRDLEMFLMTLRYREGRVIEAEGNRPLLLDDRENAWVVYSGKVDVFVVQVEQGAAVGSRRHLFRAEAGQALLGMDLGEAGDGIGLLAVGVPETRLLKLDKARLREMGTDLEYAGPVALLLETWIAGLSRAFAGEPGPRDALPLDEAGETLLQDGQTAYARKGMLWIRHLEGSSRLGDAPDLPIIGTESFVPLARLAWLRACGASRLQVATAGALIGEEAIWNSVEAYHGLALKALSRQQVEAEAEENARLRARAEADQLVVRSAVSELASLLIPEGAREPKHIETETEPLLAACQLVGAALGIQIRNPPTAGTKPAASDALKAIAQASNIRTRQVALKGEWWAHDNGALLGFVESDQRPVALLPVSPGRYEMRDPIAGTRVPLSAGQAARLSPFAHSFYPPFPQRTLTVLDLLRFGAQGMAGDWLTVLLMGLLMGLIALVSPLATGFIFDSVVPAADRGLLITIGLALLVTAFATASFQIARGVAALRIEGRMNTLTEAAVWDRLLSLPATFFRNYSSGDLGVRAMGISTMRRTIASTATTALLTSIFSLFTLALLFAYDASLALVALALVLGSIAATLLAGYLQLRYQRALIDLQGRISGIVLQLINGIAKFRVAGAEGHAFALWAKAFAAQRQLAFSARSVHNGLSVFNAAYPLLTLLTIFAMLGLSGHTRMSTGSFLAFNTAFGQLMSTGFFFSSALITLLGLVPVYERAKPILQTLPEVSDSRQHPGELSGEIELNHVSFRYRENGPLILKDVSFHVKAGEFVALVGTSGSGKSTLLRLLLGFESPESGAIYYDGQDLAGLDLRAVRQQLGVVLQTARLMTGDIFSNIVGSAPLTLDDAWQAAALCGLDEDIKQMPMGMHTLIGEGGGTFSGGQRQRLLIARAIVRKPRIIFFDESTSALDNRTQEIVTRSLKGLQAARVVIAHRLSTIMHADRICVLDDGRIVQEGTYEELVQQPGLFYELARRQFA